MPGHGKGPLRIALEDFADTSPFWTSIGNWVGKGIEWFEGVFMSVFSPILDIIPTIPDVPDELQPKNMIREMGKHQGGIAALLGFGSSMGMSAASGLMAPLMRMLNYEMDERFRTARFDPLVAFAAMRRVPGMAEEWTKELYGLGWDDEQIGGWFELSKQLISTGDLLALWLRHDRSDPAIDAELERMGWTDERIDTMKELTEVIPSVSDLITMAVREAWRDDVAERFGYDQDFPAEVVQWAQRQGLDEEWVRRYWRAHWILPGVTQAFEMLHRLRPGTTDNPFTLEDMETMLRTADIPAAFRDWLIAISYSPYTRVDVRRMYGVGVLDRDAVKSAYLDIGYDDEHAEKLTEFTIFEETEGQRSVTRAVIERGYRRLVIPYDEARQSLIDIGYSDDNADLFLAIADAELAEGKINDRLDRAEFLYIEGELNEAGVYEELGDLNLPTEQIADLIYRWEISRLKKVSLPTKSELEDMYQRDILDLAQLREGLRKRRYDDMTIAWYTQRLDQRIAEDAAKEAERAQKEQERIEAAEFATVYQRTKAAMDVEIAMIKLEMADIKLAMNFMIEPAQIDDAKAALLLLRRDIAEMQVGKAEIKLEYLG